MPFGSIMAYGFMAARPASSTPELKFRRHISQSLRATSIRSSRRNWSCGAISAKAHAGTEVPAPHLPVLTPELKFRRHVRSIDRFGAVLAKARFKRVETANQRE